MSEQSFDINKSCARKLTTIKILIKESLATLNGAKSLLPAHSCRRRQQLTDGEFVTIKSHLNGTAFTTFCLQKTSSFDKLFKAEFSPLSARTVIGFVIQPPQIYFTMAKLANIL